MTYAINGIELMLQPTSGRWVFVEPVGITGDGHFIFGSVQQFVLSWGIMSIPEFEQILGFYNQQGLTGTVVVSLPQWNASSYVFYNYSGCVLQRPEVGEYFAEHVQGVSLLVSNIQT